MNKNLIVIMGLTVSVGMLSGCVDTSGYDICKDSLDNLCLPDGYKLIGYDSDFISGNEDAYFVWYHISHDNITEWVGMRPYEFMQYWYKTDELVYYGDNSTIRGWICND